MRALTFAAARLEGTRTMKLALTILVATFSDEQKKTADELLAPHMGLLPTMLAMRGGSMTGMGSPRASQCHSVTSADVQERARKS